MINQGYSDAKQQIAASGLQGNARDVYEESAALLNQEIGGSTSNEIQNRRDMHLSAYYKLKNSLNN